MSNLYNAQKKANQEIDSIVHNLLTDGGSVNLNLLLLQLTGRHAVSEGSIKRRIDKYLDIYQDVLTVEGNDIISKGREENNNKKKGE